MGTSKSLKNFRFISLSLLSLLTYMGTNLPRPLSASELYRPSDRRLSATLMPSFADIAFHVVSVTYPCCRILGFLDRYSGIWGCKDILSRPPLWSGGQRSWLQIRDVLCSLWGTNWIYILCVEERPPLWPSGQSSWIHNGDVLCFLWGTNWIIYVT
jgi:hypothetical protein